MRAAEIWVLSITGVIKTTSDEGPEWRTKERLRSWNDHFSKLKNDRLLCIAGDHKPNTALEDYLRDGSTAGRPLQQ